ncbi:MAG: UPF0182 family protein, partial [Actinomyces sp.]
MALVAVAVAFVLLLSLRGIAIFYTDYLWFDAVGRTDVWRRVLGAKVALSIIFIGLFFVLAWFNLFIADRLAPPFRTAGPEEEMLARYHDFVAGRTGLLRLAVAGLFALIAGAGVSSQWEEWLLFVNGRSFGVDDPLFGRDIGFYVFQLPFLSFVVSWLFASLVIVFVLTTVAHYLNGGIRVQAPPDRRVTPQVKMHLSIILAALALVKTGDYWLQRFELTVSTRGVVDGALYTDVKAQLPALNLLLLISVFAVVLFVVNVRRRGWVLPVVATGLWAFVAIVMGGIYPAFVQRFRVDPNTTTREAVYTERNIAATREAFQLQPGTDLTEAPFVYSDELTPDEIRSAAATVRNARLLDPVVVQDTFERLEGEREFYRFAPVLDVDRYRVDGELTQVVVAARELNLGELDSWERQHVAITHGYGVAAARANVTTERGRPDFLVSGLPVSVDERLDATLDQPQLYYGEDLGGYALVGSTRDEVDYVDDNNQEIPFRYDGHGGVPMGSLVRRAAFALRFAQLDPLISNFIDADTRVIFERDVRTRVEKVAPFIAFDGDVFPVMLDGRVVYVLDGYTTTSRYPYAQRAETGRLPAASDLAGRRFNYVRNSVKAVVDAYDGDVTLYAMPVDDPIIEAWRDAFPGMFVDFDEMPAELRDHLRYPQDLFRVQTNMWASYQIDDPARLIIGTEKWAVAQDPGRSVNVGTSETLVSDTGAVSRREARIEPYYTLMQLPGEDDLSYVTLRSFVPISEDDSRKELTAFMVGETRPDGTSRLVSYEVTGVEAPGPAIVASNIATKPEISRELTLLNDQGSQISFGDLLLLPIEDSILYLRPLYVQAQGTSIPVMTGVVAAIGDGERIALGTDLPDALEKLFPGERFDDIVIGPVDEGGSAPPDQTPDGGSDGGEPEGEPDLAT